MKIKAVRRITLPQPPAHPAIPRHPPHRTPQMFHARHSGINSRVSSLQNPLHFSAFTHPFPSASDQKALKKCRFAPICARFSSVLKSDFCLNPCQSTSRAGQNKPARAQTTKPDRAPIQSCALKTASSTFQFSPNSASRTQNSPFSAPSSLRRFVASSLRRFVASVPPCRLCVDCVPVVVRSCAVCVSIVCRSCAGCVSVMCRFFNATHPGHFNRTNGNQYT